MPETTAGQGENSTGRSKGKGNVRAASTAPEDNSRPAKKRRTNSATPEAVTIYYDTPKAFEGTPLYTKLRELDGDGHFLRYFKYARKLYLELGPCAADLLWRRVLLGNTFDESFKAFRQLLEDWDFVLPNMISTSPRYNVSSQFAKLVDVLQSSETHSNSFRCVIMVKQSVTAVVLAILLRLLDDTLPHVRPVALTTSGTLSSPQDNVTLLHSFSSGTHNLLITNKLSEKLDLCPVTKIIHFNLLEEGPASLLARALTDRNSALHVVYMADQSNDLHKNILKHCGITNQHTPEASGTSSTVQNPPDTSMLLDEDNSIDFVEEPTTGKKINAELAPVAIERYLGSLRDMFSEDCRASTSWCELEPFQDNNLVLHLSLPDTLPIPEPLRRLETQSPQGATAQLCLSTCKQLFKAGFLRDEFFFTPREVGDVIVAGTDGHEVKKANLSANTRCYLRKKPTFWTRSLQNTSARLYPLIISVGPIDSFRDGRHAPVLILTRLPLPHFEQFPVFSNGQKAFVQLQHGAPFEIDDQKQELLLRYTLRIARALTNKPLECAMEDMLYYFAPLDGAWDSKPSDSAPWQFPKVDWQIPWQQIAEAAGYWAKKLVPEDGVLTEETVQDCVIQDRAVEFTNRHYVLKLRHDLSPRSKMKEGSAEAEPITYLDYCKSRVKEFQGLKDENQPLIEVSLVPPVANNLAPASKDTSTVKNPARLLVPELCYKFVIPASIWRTVLLLPSITHMIDRMLLVKEMRVAVFNQSIGEGDLFQAVTPVSANVEKDYERLELLGDALLKDILSTYFFATMPTKREGALSSARGQVVSNKMLHQNAMAAGMPPWIQSKPLVVKLWTPYLVARQDAGDVGTSNDHRRGKRQKQLEEQDVQWLGDKTVADVVEAVVGAAFHQGGTDNVLRTMKILQFNMPEIAEHSDFWRVYAPNAPSHKTFCDLPVGTSEAVEAITGFKFHTPAILAEALTHGSISNQHMTSYDRLEFLGDGILDSNIVWYIFKAYPKLSPGGLSLLKAAMVSNLTLAAVAVESGLYEHVRYCSKEIMSAVKLYVQKIFTLRDQEYRDAEAESRLPNQFWLEVDAPKPLADLVEAIVGAIYVSDRFGTQGVKTFFQKVLRPFYDRHIRLHTLAPHPGTSLFEFLQAEGCQQHAMRKTNLGKEVRSEVVIHDIVLASAAEPTSNLSVRKAALAALDALASDPGLIARTCDCKTQKVGSQGKKTQKKMQQLGYVVDS
ncbi:uncharacterized protein PHACADRAFT_114689 [Phanerochaete carnosa HHB-10118-sp]|uniref:Dicer-like protein 1 n=1 Tax=Phanerochaete carnosa (strain HHB-10118-sp) TaxID=650164 RepID=K5WKG6_PHACS|nr:uncharacterized protein PHACADRAFT_114689 [Phanerochaete carnosa HHB-10118-sp]EKM59649.1 hypothetical protein PHACADRAFT_114689 [Phanerochaete carnosa HHB-10118-sp]